MRSTDHRPSVRPHRTVPPCALAAFSLAAACLLWAGASAHGTETPGAEALQDELQKLIGGAFRIHVSGTAAVVTDAPDAAAAACVLHLHKVIPKMWKLASLPKDAPVPEWFVTALFTRKEDGDRFVKSRKQAPRGAYAYLHDAKPVRRVSACFVLEPRPMLARLRHMAFEALLRAWVAQPPSWLVEGLGECMEDTLLDAQGQLVLGPPRGHLRDLREKVLGGPAAARLMLKDLVRLDPDEWAKKGLVSCAESWALARFLLEDPLPREARMLFKLLSALSPQAEAKENTRRVCSAFQDDEWEDLEKAWRAYVDKLRETPAEEPYRKAREKIAQREYEAAWPLMDQAVRLDPDYERLYYFRALAAFYTGQHASSAADLTKALELFPEYHAAAFLRGRARAAQGDAAHAKEDFETCLKTPYHDLAQQALDILSRTP